MTVGVGVTTTAVGGGGAFRLSASPMVTQPAPVTVVPGGQLCACASVAGTTSNSRATKATVRTLHLRGSRPRGHLARAGTQQPRSSTGAGAINSMAPAGAHVKMKGAPRRRFLQMQIAGQE